MAIPLNKMKNYKPCEICECGDCRDGSYRNDSWFCPVLQKQICDVCCYYDMRDPYFGDIAMKCKSMRCKHYKED